MNFKPTLRKVFVSIIVLVVFTFLGSWYYSNNCATIQSFNCDFELGVCVSAGGCPSMWSLESLGTSYLFLGLFSFIIAYFIYSLIQRKQKKALKMA